MSALAHLERELKLDPGRDPIDLGALGEPLEPRTFVSTYYDTPSRSLARSGLTLRRRVENGVSLWQLKLPADEGRIEVEVQAGPRAPAELTRVLAAHLRRERLETVATLRTRRSGVRVTRQGRSAADVLRDEVTVLEDRRAVGAFEELEVELVEGDAADLRSIERRLLRAGAIAASGAPKLARVIGDRRPVHTRGGPPSEHLIAMLTVQLAELLASDALIRHDLDVEAVHQLRVATRRLRAYLRAGRAALGREVTEPIRDELSWLRSVAGPARDLDIMSEYLAGELADFPDEDRKAARPLQARLARQRKSARKALLGGLSSPRYFALLETLEQLVSAPPPQKDVSLEDTARREFRRVRRQVKALGDPTDEELHRVRIGVKRARYSTEVAEASMGSAASRVIDRAKKIQEVIGEHQDAVVTEEWLRRARAVGERPEAALVAGALVERQRARRARAREAFPRAWKKLDKAGRRAWTS